MAYHNHLSPTPLCKEDKCKKGGGCLHTWVFLALWWFFKVKQKVPLVSHNLVWSACFSPLMKDGLEVTEQKGQVQATGRKIKMVKQHKAENPSPHPGELLWEAGYTACSHRSWVDPERTEGLFITAAELLSLKPTPVQRNVQATCHVSQVLALLSPRNSRKRT